jgi:heme/copper-type cytochrome/quinol oxidase subunit 2
VGTLVGIGIVVMALSLPGMIAPGAVWDIFSSWQFRNPEAMRPSNRNFGVARISSASLFVLGAMAVVGPVWPGTLDAKLTAALVAGLIGFVVLIVIVVLVIVVRHRRIAVGAASEETPPVNEPSGAAYGLEFIAIGVHVILVFVIVFSLIGVQQRTKAEVHALFHPKVTAQDQKDIDEAEMNFNTIDLDPQPVMTAAPAGAELANSFDYDVVNVAKRLPRNAWDQSVPDHGADSVLKKSGLVLDFPAFSCTVTGLIVIETTTTVTVGVTVTGETPVGQSGPLACLAGNGSTTYLQPVPLAAPLGSRTVLQLDGTPVDKPLTVP